MAMNKLDAEIKKLNALEMQFHRFPFSGPTLNELLSQSQKVIHLPSEEQSEKTKLHLQKILPGLHKLPFQKIIITKLIEELQKE